jgi:hypothetical protein
MVLRYVKNNIASDLAVPIKELGTITSIRSKFIKNTYAGFKPILEPPLART